MSIHFWIKEKQAAILFWLIIILVATTSFAAGYLMAREGDRVPIIIDQCHCNGGE